MAIVYVHVLELNEFDWGTVNQLEQFLTTNTFENSCKHSKVEIDYYMEK